MNIAEIGGQLTFIGAKLMPHEGVALNAHRVTVQGSLVWRNMTIPTGPCNFTDSHFQNLVDDPDCWPSEENLCFVGMTYDRFWSGSTTKAKSRLDWLQRGSFQNGEFHLQSYSQFSEVLGKAKQSMVRTH